MEHILVAAVLGTNPICFGFPIGDYPVIVEIATSAIAHAEVTLAWRLGNQLPEGVAFDCKGSPTRDPDGSARRRVCCVGQAQRFRFGAGGAA